MSDDQPEEPGPVRKAVERGIGAGLGHAIGRGLGHLAESTGYAAPGTSDLTAGAGAALGGLAQDTVHKVVDKLDELTSGPGGSDYEPNYGDVNRLL